MIAERTPSAASGQPRTELARLLHDRQRPVLGSWVKMPTVESIELLGIAGHDFVIVDLEHSCISVETAALQIGYARASDLTVFARVAGISDPTASKLLDAGAHGVLFPHVDSPEDAVRASAAVRFPPRGVRGVSGATRMGGWGSTPRDEFMQRGKEHPACIIQIESAAGVSAVSDIASVGGIDMLFIGAVDLAAEMGTDESEPEVEDGIRKMLTVARRAGVPVGASFASAEGLAGWADEIDLLVIGNDAGFLRGAAERERRAVSGALPRDPHG